MRTSIRSVIAVGLVALLLAGTAQADLLNLTREHYPRLGSGYIAVDYNATTGLLQADGWSLVVDHDANPANSIDLWDGVFDLDVTINPSTGEATGGTLTITGDYDGVNTETLFYSNTLTAFGSGAEDLFEFRFVQDGSSPLYADADGESIGIILDGREILDFSVPTFGSDFTNDGFGTSETFFMPEPGITVLMAIGAGALLRRRRRGTR